MFVRIAYGFKRVTLILTFALAVLAQPAPAQAPDVMKRPFAPASPRSGTTLFELLPADHTGVDFLQELTDPAEQRRSERLQSVYGVCVGDYDGDGLTDFYATSPVGGNRLYRNLGDFRFQDVTAEAGLQDPDFVGSAATFADVDNDGDLDLYASAVNMPNRLYLNQGGGPGRVQFVESAERLGLDYNGASKTMAFADIDGDGDLDGYLATNDTPPPATAKFSVHLEGNRPVVDKAVRQYWQLLYLPGNRIHRIDAGEYDHLYRNEGDRFVDISEEAGIAGPYITLSAVWWDYNNDGRPDLYASNDFLGPDCLYRNDGGCRFTDVAASTLPQTPWFSMGSDVGDVNNDGLVDFLATDMLARTHERRSIMSGSLADEPVTHFLQPQQELRNVLFLNQGVDRPLEMARQLEIDRSDWTWNPRLADFDNDGFLDLFITTGMYRDVMNADLTKQANAIAPGSQGLLDFWARQPMLKEPNVALRNDEGSRFEDVGAAWGLDRVGVSYGAVTADFDNDGDLDLVVNNADAPLSIYRNNAGGNSLRLELRGTSSNRFGIGATITCETSGRRQAAYLTLARGWMSALEPAVHFGLGDATQAEAVTIRWPSGQVQRIQGLQAGFVYTITEPAGELAPASAPPKTMFVENQQSPSIVHQELPFNDFAVQPLLPYRLSLPGPALAWADVDSDGDVDLFLGGSRGSSGRLFLNEGQGDFQHAAENFSETFVGSETAAALFFDADGDHDLDLYLANGSVEHHLGDPSFSDDLFLNDGTGKFARAPSETLPTLHDSGSSVAAADFDQDGDVDLFVGSRSVPSAYPTMPENHMLVNEGGKFTEATPDTVKAAGMVTDACWADVDGDGWLDLAVTTDWGPVRLFKNHEGQLTEITEQAGLAKRTGWWLAIAPGDLDADGDLDFVVTNFGRNTPYRASPGKPLEAYYGDVEGLGTPRFIEVEWEDGKRYPRRYFQTLQAALPTLGTKFESYAQFSTATLEEVIAPDRLNQLTYIAATELDSGILINDGQGRFTFTPLPDLAQIAPASDVAISDLNGDGQLDVVLAQNLLTFNSEVGRIDGGLSLVLLGNRNGQFESVSPRLSGIVIPEQARHVAPVDVNGDKLPDLVFATQGPLHVLLHSDSQ